MTLDLSKNPLPLIIGKNRYRLDDPTGNSIYRSRRSYEQETTNQLNKPILWKTDKDGFVVLQFEFVLKSKQRYLPEQLPTLLAFFGAMYTFYDQDLTEEVFIQSDLSEDEKRGNIEALRDGFTKKYRDWFYDGVFLEIKLNVRDKYYEIIIKNTS